MRNAIALIVASALLVPGIADAASRVIEGATDAKPLKSLRLEAHVGEVEVQAGDGDRITWRLTLEPDGDDGWFSRRDDAQRAVEGAEVRATAAGDAWQLELDLPRGIDFDDVEEHWEVTVPRRFAVEIDANVGRVEVVGVAGGVEAELNVGELRVEVPSGDVSVRANVGEVRVVSATKSPGEVRLSANIGDTDLRISGKTTKSGSSFGLGSMAVSSSSGGEDDITAKVNVGDVGVRIE